MTKKKHKNEQEVDEVQTGDQKEVVSEQPFASGQKESNDSSEDNQVSALKDLHSKLADMNDKYLRLFSEFDNYRKRTAKEKLELSRTASEGVIYSLLPVLDDMERAVQAVPDELQNDGFIEGMKLIYNKFRNIMVQKGLEEVPAFDQPFDTDLHEAVSHFAVEDTAKKNKIIDVLQKGYKLNDKVIRYAKVVVGL